jgi:hypothetical protein
LILKYHHLPHIHASIYHLFYKYVCRFLVRGIWNVAFDGIFCCCMKRLLFLNYILSKDRIKYSRYAS